MTEYASPHHSPGHPPFRGQRRPDAEHHHVQEDEHILGNQMLGEPNRDVPERRILVVEDAADLAAHLATALRDVARDIQVCHDGNMALESVRRQPPDLIILDVGLPGMSGLDVCRILRGEGMSLPILMLSGRCGEIDRILGLELGADDYLVKPFGVLELLARVRALFRRVALSRESDAPRQLNGRIALGDLVVDPQARQVVRNGSPIEVTEREFDLLHLLAANPGRVYSRGQLLDLVWGHGSGVYEYAVTTHINRLRRKIEANPERPELIQTVWGLGYRLNAHRRRS